MINWRKTALWTAAGISVLVAGAAVAVHVLVDSARLRQIAHDKAQAAWGRELSIGEVSLALWPLPALYAERMALANPPWARDPELLQADGVTARLALLPLLIGKVRIKSLYFEGLKASLEVGPDGARSWDLKGRGNSSGADLMSLEDLLIENADIYYRPKGAPASLWHVDTAHVDGSSGLRDVCIEASLARNKRPLRIAAQLDDLSRFGIPGAVTDGKVDLDWGKTQVAITGRIPLEKSLKGYAVKADLKSASLNDLLDFFRVAQGPTAPAEAHVALREAGDRIEATQLAATLGKLRVTGDVQISTAGAKPLVTARLEADRVDWVRTLLDAGVPPLPPLPPDEMLHDNPLGWPALVALQGLDGKVELKVKSLLLRNGIELKNTRAQSTFNDDRWNMTSFTTEMLGGSATGNILLEGRKKTVRMKFDGTGLLLERWFKERGSKIPFTGGPMKLNATITATGGSMKDLAATMTGPVAIRMGPGVFASEKAGKAEAMMTGAPKDSSPKDVTEIDFECVSASLPFNAGKASGERIVGARSSASHLITSGSIDMREEAVDLRGRMIAKSGVSAGIAAITGDVKITGKLRHPKMTLDPLGTPGAIARVGAAIATAGISLVGTAIADAAEAKKNDPCDVVFRR